jgi:hypothetical protein
MVISMNDLSLFYTKFFRRSKKLNNFFKKNMRKLKFGNFNIDIYLKLRHKKCQWEDLRPNKIKQLFFSALRYTFIILRYNILNNPKFLKKSKKS